MNSLVFFMLASAIYFNVNEACKPNEIIIWNDIGPGRTLQYHCRWKKKDLGVKYLNYGATTTIKLKDEGMEITTWHCLLKHGLYMRFYRDIIAYSQNTVEPHCGQHREWIARKSGIHFRKDPAFPSGRSHIWYEK